MLISMNSWKPLITHVDNTLVDDVPEYLLESLIEWAQDSEQLLNAGYNDLGRIEDDRPRFIQRFDRKRRAKSGLSQYDTDRCFRLEYQRNADLIFDYLDYLVFNVAQLPSSEDDDADVHYDYPGSLSISADYGQSEITEDDIQEQLDDLDDILEEGGSKWRVGRRGKLPGLLERITPAMDKAADKAMTDCDNAGELLASAWQQLFGCNPNPSEAYSNTVKAIEAATKDSLGPNDKVYTLGKGLNTMRNQHWKYMIEVDNSSSEARRNVDGGVIQLMMRSIWEAQRNRHGDENGVPDISPEEARAAIFLAVPIIQAFHDGFIVGPNQ